MLLFVWKWKWKSHMYLWIHWSNEVQTSNKSFGEQHEIELISIFIIYIHTYAVYIVIRRNSFTYICMYVYNKSLYYQTCNTDFNSEISQFWINLYKGNHQSFLEKEIKRHIELRRDEKPFLWKWKLITINYKSRKNNGNYFYNHNFIITKICAWTIEK